VHTAYGCGSHPGGSNVFRKLFLKKYFRVILGLDQGYFGKITGGGEGWRRGERPNILNIVAWRNNLATFDSQQLATLF